jgi:hypothetical protein
MSLGGIIIKMVVGRVGERDEKDDVGCLFLCLIVLLILFI